MNAEIGAEAALFPEKEYINRIAVAVHTISNRSFHWVHINIDDNAQDYYRLFYIILLYFILPSFTPVWNEYTLVC